MSGNILTFVVVNEKDEYVSQEYNDRGDAINDARFRTIYGDQKYAVVEFMYEFAESNLAWAPDGADTWPPGPPPEREDLIRLTKSIGDYQFQCPTGLCNHLFKGSEVVPGESLDCPECGGQIPVSPKFRVRLPGDEPLA